MAYAHLTLSYTDLLSDDLLDLDQLDACEEEIARRRGALARFTPQSTRDAYWQAVADLYVRNDGPYTGRPTK